MLHLLAIAHEAGVALTLDDLTAVAAVTPVIASLAPAGRWVAEDLHARGRHGRGDRRADPSAGSWTAPRRRCDGSTLAEATAAAPAPDGEVRLHRSTALQAEPGG